MKRAPAILAIAAITIVAVLGIASSEPVIRRLTFMAAPLPAEQRDPRVWGVDADEVWLEAADGVRLHGWWFDRPPSDAGCATVIHMHGNAGNLTSRRGIAASLVAAGHDVLLFDYRGYGASEGAPDEAGLYADGVAAYRFATDSLGVPADRVVLMAHSLGTAVATEVAKHHPVGAVILGAPFTSLPEAARAQLRVVPRWLFDWEDGRFDAAADMPAINAPVLIGIGTRDDLVDESVARELYDVTREPKQWISIDGAGHNDMFNATFMADVDRFIRRHLGCEPVR